MSCRHKSIVVVGSDETSARSARCQSCGVALARRIEGGDYVYFVLEDAVRSQPRRASERKTP